MSGFADKVPIVHLCEWAQVPPSVYYYAPLPGSPGRKPSIATKKSDGSTVSNEAVVQEIRTILSDEFMSVYGYELVRAELCRRSYLINKKKVYRLMAENDLLLSRPITTSGSRNFVKFRQIKASYPMEYLCIDIKYVWVHGEKRHGYMLTVIDVFSRKVLGHIVQHSIRKKDVVALFKRIDGKNSIRGVIIRNDNGPQFIAGLVKNYFRLAEVTQEFTHPSTPQENSYIEAYHSIFESAVCQRYEFQSLYEARLIIANFVDFYNTRRPHRSIGFRTPEEMWKARLALRSSVRPPECAGEELSRTTDTIENQPADSSLRIILDNSRGREYLCQTDDLKQHEENPSVNLNHFLKSVQEYGG